MRDFRLPEEYLKKLEEEKDNVQRNLGYKKFKFLEPITNSVPNLHHKKHLDKYRKLRLIQGPNDEDLPGDLLSLGDSEHASESLKKVLEGIGYSSTRKAAMDNAKKGFRGT